MDIFTGIVRPGDIVMNKSSITGKTYIGVVTYVHYKYGWYTARFAIPGSDYYFCESFFINEVKGKKKQMSTI